MCMVEIVTQNGTKKFENPRQAKITQKLFYSIIEVMDENGVWHIVCRCSIKDGTGKLVVEQINDAIIKQKENLWIHI